MNITDEFETQKNIKSAILACLKTYGTVNIDIIMNYTETAKGTLKHHLTFLESVGMIQKNKFGKVGAWNITYGLLNVNVPNNVLAKVEDVGYIELEELAKNFKFSKNGCALLLKPFVISNKLKQHNKNGKPFAFSINDGTVSDEQLLKNSNTIEILSKQFLSRPLPKKWNYFL